MASQYRVLGSYTTLRVLGSNAAIDVEAITIETKPTLIRLTVMVPLTDFKADTYVHYLVTTADLVESVIAADYNTGATTNAPGPALIAATVYNEDTDAAGLLAAYLSFLVQVAATEPANQPLSQWETFPMTKFETAAAFDTAPSPIVTITNTYQRLLRLSQL